MHEIIEKLTREKTYFWGIYEAAVLIEIISCVDKYILPKLSN